MQPVPSSGVSQMASFAHEYRMLPDSLKRLLTAVNKAAGKPNLALSLCGHLRTHAKGTDDNFWDTVKDNDGALVIGHARALGLSTVGACNIAQAA